MIRIKEDYIMWLMERYAVNWPDSPDIDRIRQLKEADIQISKYFGTYGGCEALFISESGVVYLTWIVNENIAGYDICFPSSQPLYIHKDSAFIEMSKAYETGVITKQDVRDIKWYLNGDI